MPLPVRSSAFITCALTGSGDSTGASDKVPVTPEQIASSALEAAAAGAAVVHIHVRDPETGKGSRDPKLFAEVVERVRDSKVDVVLNLTTGMGGDLVLGGPEAPLPPVAGTDMATVHERLSYVRELKPEICTLDAGTRLAGPCVIEEAGSTTVVEQGMAAAVLPDGQLLIEVNP